jgi:formylmethanofuran dehydrogenase subunit E
MIDLQHMLEEIESPYREEHKTNKKCFKCGEHLYEEVIEEINYPLVCLNCDENMYEFEAVK